MTRKSCCPKCDFDNPLVGQWWLVRKDRENIYMQPSVVDGKLHIEIKNGTDVPEGTCSGGKGVCLSCGAIIPNDAVRKDIAEREEERLLAVVLKKSRGKEYVLPSDEDFEAFERAKDEVEAHLKQRLDEFWNYGLRGADLTVSAMGATLDVITRYSDIKSYTGEMKIKDVLEAFLSLAPEDPGRQVSQRILERTGQRGLDEY